MKIMLFNAFYYPKLVGGAELSVQLLAESLSNLGNTVYVVSLSNRNYVAKKNGVICIYLKERNLYSLDNTGHQVKLAKILWHIIDSANLLYYRIFKSLFKRIRPDVFHTNTLSGVSPMVWKAAREERVAVIHTFRDYYAICHKRTLYNNKNCEKLCLQCTISCNLKRAFSKNVDAFVGISKYILEKHKEYNFIDSTTSVSKVIFNSITPVPADDQKGKEDSGTNVQFGFIGRITPEKGLEQTLKVVDGVEGSGDFRILIAGKVDADYRKALEQLVSRKERIKFLGFTSQSDFFRMTDVLIVPSLWNEPFGRVVIEALSYGVPVIISNRGGLRELYDRSCMWMFDPATDGLKTIVEEILAQPGLVKEKAAAAPGVSALFSSSKIADQYNELYNQLVTTV